MYFNRVISAHGTSVDVYLQLPHGRRVQFEFELGDFRFALRMSLIPCFHLGFDLGKLFHLGFYLREFLALSNSMSPSTDADSQAISATAPPNTSGFLAAFTAHGAGPV
jgi:hypothetical protein